MDTHKYPNNWRTIRAAVLKRDNHECQMQLHGCLGDATTVDHIIPIASGGTHTLDNLRAACTACNYSKGGKEGRNKQLGRQKPAQPQQAPFLRQDTSPPIGHGISLRRAGATELEPVYGSVEARVHSPLLGGESLADDVIAWAAEHTQPLFPWQEWLLRDALQVTDSGQLRRKTVLMLVSRQNGKTHLARVMMAYFMATRPGFSIVGVAQKLSLAEETWEQVVDLFRDAPGLRDLIPKNGVRLRNGAQQLRLTNGSTYSIIAASRKARGKTADLVYVDELREVTADAWAALQPFVTATAGQIWATSNAGDLSSLALNTLRSNILGMPSERMAVYEWSAHDRLAIDDLDGWRDANPSLGHMITVETLQDAMLAATTPEQFRTERLCQFVLALNPAIPMESVEACADVGKQPEIGLGPTWAAIDTSTDSRRADLVIAQLVDDEIRVKTLYSWQHPSAIDPVLVAREIGIVCAPWRITNLVYNHYASDSIINMLGTSFPLLEMSGARFAKACEDLRGAMVHKRVRHDNTPDLVQHFAHAVARPASDGGWRMVRRESGGYISIACAAAMAVSAASGPRVTPLIMSA